jgi:hypothetical protein
MAKVLERCETLYDEDLLAWAERQAELLRAGQLDRLDVAHLIDELEAMAGKLRRELKNRLRILLAHLSKWEHRCSHSWATSIAEQRDQISALLEENRAFGRTSRPLRSASIRVQSGWRRSTPGCGGTAPQRSALRSEGHAGGRGRAGRAGERLS